MSGFKDLDLRRKIVSVPIFTPRSFFLGRYFFFISRFLCSSSKSQIFQIISSVEKCVGPFWNNLRQLLKLLAADIWRKGGWCKGPLVPLGPGSLGLSPAFSVECRDKNAEHRQRKIFASRSFRILIEL